MYYMGEKTHILTLVRFSSQIKAKGKAHVCFPNRSPHRPGAALQAASVKPHLTTIIWGYKCVLSLLANLHFPTPELETDGLTLIKYVDSAP